MGIYIYIKNSINRDKHFYLVITVVSFLVFSLFEIKQFYFLSYLISLINI